MEKSDLHRQFVGKRALVTGGMGFVGSNLVRRLVSLNTEVHVVDAMWPRTGANEFNLDGFSNEIQYTRADVRDEAVMAALLPGQDYLFNVAGLLSHVGGMRDPVSHLEVNALAQIRLLEACRRINPEIRIVFAGTRQVYGRMDRIPVSEETCTLPTDYNGVSKLAGELYHLISSRVYGLWTTTLRMTNTYGPRMRVRDAHQMFIGWWIRLALERREIPVFGNGQQVRDFNFVDDAVNAFLLSVANPLAKGKVYNLGAAHIRLLDLAQLLISLNGSGSYSVRPFPRDRLAIDINDYAGDYTRIRSELGWEPETSLEQGLRATLEFYRLNKAYYW